MLQNIRNTRTDRRNYRQPWRPVAYLAAVVALLAVSCGSAETVHVVQSGEKLSDIAERHCESAAAVDSIFERNAGRFQPDGQTFTDPNLIVPGQELQVDCGKANPVQSLMKLFETNQTEAIGLTGLFLLGLAIVGVARRSFRHDGSPVRAPARPSRPAPLGIMHPAHPNARYQVGNPVWHRLQVERRAEQQRRDRQRQAQQRQDQQRQAQQRQDQQRQAQQRMQQQRQRR